MILLGNERMDSIFGLKGCRLTSALQRTAAPLGSRAVRIICQRLSQPTGRFRRRSLSLVIRPDHMTRNFQTFVSLALAIGGVLVSAYHAGQLSVRTACDERYSRFIESGEVRIFFHELNQNDYFYKHFAVFRPSGLRYSGSNESAIPIVGGAAVGILGIAGVVDTMRSRKTASKA
jgi:hypothetical protein